MTFSLVSFTNHGSVRGCKTTTLPVLYNSVDRSTMFNFNFTNRVLIFFPGGVTGCYWYQVWDRIAKTTVLS